MLCNLCLCLCNFDFKLSGHGHMHDCHGSGMKFGLGNTKMIIAHTSPIVFSRLKNTMPISTHRDNVFGFSKSNSLLIEGYHSVAHSLFVPYYTIPHKASDGSTISTLVILSVARGALYAWPERASMPLATYRPSTREQTVKLLGI